MDDETAPYRVDRHGEAYAVFVGQGDVICVCGEELNARHYETLLRKAYRRGHKAGYRTAKRSG